MQGKYDGSLEDAFHVAEVVDAALLQAGRLLVLLVLLHLLHHPLKVVRVIHLREPSGYLTTLVGKRTHHAISSNPSHYSIS